ncbi:MAG: MarR family winged helix-turn-helix transcriptional regulator [Alphaproteobacteria bacterium]
MSHKNLSETYGLLMLDIINIARNKLDKFLEKTGLTKSQWEVITFINRFPGIKQLELAEKLYVKPISLTRMIDRLEKKNFVCRKPDANDRRINRLHLTEISYPLLEEINLQREIIREIGLKGIEEDKFNIMLDCLIKIRDNLLKNSKS